MKRKEPLPADKRFSSGMKNFGEAGSCPQADMLLNFRNDVTDGALILPGSGRLRLYSCPAAHKYSAAIRLACSSDSGRESFASIFPLRPMYTASYAVSPRFSTLW